MTLERLTQEKTLTTPQENSACYLCQQALVPKFKKQSITLYQCSACSFLQILPQDYLSQIKEFYSEQFFKMGKFVTDGAVLREQQRRLVWLKNLVKPGARILDIGCALGDFLIAAKGDYEVCGSDVSSYAVSIAKERIPERAEHIRAGTLEELQYESASFDALVAWDVIEHLTDPRAALEEMRRILKPGGVLCLSTPNSGALTAKLLRSYWAFMTPPEHVFFFSKETLESFLQSSGFVPLHWMSRGKWVNGQFLCFKVAQMFPAIFPERISALVKQSPLASFIFYIPTGDVQYVGAQLSPSGA